MTARSACRAVRAKRAHAPAACRTRRCVAAALVAWTLAPAGGLANEAEPGARVAPPSPPPLPVGFALVGAGEFRWFGLRIYDARLWAAPAAFDPARLESSRFALELRYARALGGAAIAERSDEEIAALGIASAATRTRWRDRMRVVFPDVVAGDTLLGVHDPGEPTRFFHNGRAIGAIGEPGFGAAFFAIWLDPRTRAPALRDALLGQRGRSMRS